MKLDLDERDDIIIMDRQRQWTFGFNIYISAILLPYSIFHTCKTRLYIWQYNEKGDLSSPTIVLRTRRSLRAVHFHPHASPLLLTAEVNDLDAPDSPMTVATSPGYLEYSPPAVFFTPVHLTAGSGSPVSSASHATMMPFPCFFWPGASVNENNMRGSETDGLAIDSHARDSEAENTQTLQSVRQLDLQTQSPPTAALEDVSPRMPHAEPLPEFANPSEASENMLNVRQPSERGNATYESGVDMLLRAAEGHASSSGLQRNSLSIADEVEDVELSNQAGTSGRFQFESENLVESSSSMLPERHEGQAIGSSPIMRLLNITHSVNVHLLLGSGQLHPFLPIGDQPGWEFPFLQGWVMGQTQAGLSPILSGVGGRSGMQTVPSDVRISESYQLQQNPGVSLASAGMAAVRFDGRSAGHHRSHLQLNSQEGIGVGVRFHSAREGAQPSLGTAQAAAAQAHTHTHYVDCIRQKQSNCLDLFICRMKVTSEMGAHFSPCGRFLAACVACVLPQHESETSLQSQLNQGFGGTATSPTRHPISAQQVVYELRIYSLEDATFGEVLASRAIRAAHCLTSIQFSPTSAHILLAYGRRHTSLLRRIVIDGTATIPVYTILEIYRVSDMQLVRVLPSAEDEVNVACFHPLVGGGLVYGTKEGKLRILIYDRSQNPENSSGIEANVFEAG